MLDLLSCRARAPCRSLSALRRASRLGGAARVRGKLCRFGEAWAALVAEHFLTYLMLPAARSLARAARSAVGREEVPHSPHYESTTNP